MLKPKHLWAYSIAVYGIALVYVFGIPVASRTWFCGIFLPVILFLIPLILFTNLDGPLENSKEMKPVSAFLLKYRMLILIAVLVIVLLIQYPFIRNMKTGYLVFDIC